MLVSGMICWEKTVIIIEIDSSFVESLIRVQYHGKLSNNGSISDNTAFNAILRFIYI